MDLILPILSLDSICTAGCEKNPIVSQPPYAKNRLGTDTFSYHCSFERYVFFNSATGD